MIQTNARTPHPAQFDQLDDDGFRQALPMQGAINPSTDQNGTTPGSFANAPDIGGPLSFSSPDTPGMPEVSNKTAWDFLPEGWTVEMHPDGCLGHGRGDAPIRAIPVNGFKPVTQLEHARLGTITPEMERVAERESLESDHRRKGRECIVADIGAEQVEFIEFGVVGQVRRTIIGHAAVLQPQSAEFGEVGEDFHPAVVHRRAAEFESLQVW